MHQNSCAASLSRIWTVSAAAHDIRAARTRRACACGAPIWNVAPDAASNSGDASRDQPGPLRARWIIVARVDASASFQKEFSA